MALKKGPKFALYALGIGGTLYFANYAMHNGLVPVPPVQQSKPAQTVTLPDVPAVDIPSKRSVPAQPVALPVTPQQNGVAPLKCEYIAWNALSGLVLANGGASTAPGSLVANEGSSLTLVKNNDGGQMKSNLVLFANDLANGNPQPTRGTPCIIIMHDGSPGAVTGADEILGKLGEEYKLKNVASFGFSRGEDKFMGPAEWKTNPQLMKGKTVCGVVADGDWNIAMIYMGNNGICNNPDLTTYDPNCVNWINTDDHIIAVKNYMSGFSEDRKVVGSYKTQKVKCDGVVTWTPGDVMLAKEKGGLVSLLSTRENFWQMPSAMLIIDKYAKANRANIEGIIAAGLNGGDLMKNDDMQRRKAAALVAQTFEEQDADYWYTYFTPQQEKDATNVLVSLGGSSVNGMSDALFIYGLAPDSTDIISSVYTTFGKLLVTQYPDRLAAFAPAEQVIDKSYLKNVAARPRMQAAKQVEPEKPAINQASHVVTKVASRAYAVEFDTGKATLSPDAEKTLQEILSNVTVSGGLAIQIIGYTDNTGNNPARNQTLSEQRAFSVLGWLKDHGKGMPNIENAHAEGRGQADPIVPNDTTENKRKNRRVQIILGATS